MKTQSPLVLLGLCSLLALTHHEAAAQPASVDVRVDPRVELVSIIFRLAGNPEYNVGKIDAYNDAIDAYFGPFSDHPAIAFARRLRDEQKMGFSKCMYLAVFLKDGLPLEPRVSLDTKWPFGWRRDDARAFVEHAQAFVEDTDFEAFLAQHQPLYDLAEARMRTLLAESVDLTWFEAFFGTQPELEFKLVLGLVNGTANYGPRFRNPDGPDELYSILGVWLTDEEGMPRFDQSVVATIIHEFNHSFVNPVTGPLFAEMADAGKTIQAAVAPEMARQGYGQWTIMINESLVRAAVVRYFAANETPETVAHEIAQQKQNYFVWIDELSDLLGQYEAARDTYPTFASFLPAIATFYNDLAPRITDLVQQYEAAQGIDKPEQRDTTPPTVVSTVPPNGATDVDPALTEIVFRFDRPMNTGGYSVMTQDEEGRKHYPEVSKAGYNETGTAFTLHVTLKPNWRYTFWLNSPDGGAFRSQDGVMLEAYPMEFHTGPAR